MLIINIVINLYLHYGSLGCEVRAIFYYGHGGGQCLIYEEN